MYRYVPPPRREVIAGAIELMPLKMDVSPKSARRARPAESMRMLGYGTLNHWQLTRTNEREDVHSSGLREQP